MNNLVKVISTRIGSKTRRLIKYLRYGKNDIQESFEVSPYGFDSVPVKDMIALYSSTGEIGKNVIIGYINKNKVAKVGENRLFATDENGNEKTYLYLTNSGDLELNGNTDNAVRYSELEKSFNELKTDLNGMIQAWNTFATSYVPGSPTTVGLPPTLASSTVSVSTVTVTNAKIDNIKTN